MPKEVKESLRKEIFTNIIICACLVAYFLFLFPKPATATKQQFQKSWNFMTHISISAVCVRFTTITTTYVLR